MDDGHGFPLRVASGGSDDPAEKGGDTGDVFHHLLRIMKGGGADTLEDEAAAGGLAGLGVDTEGVVDVAGAVAHGPHDLPAEVKGGQGLGKILFSLGQPLHLPQTVGVEPGGGLFGDGGHHHRLVLFVGHAVPLVGTAEHLDPGLALLQQLGDHAGKEILRL